MRKNYRMSVSGSSDVVERLKNSDALMWSVKEALIKRVIPSDMNRNRELTRITWNLFSEAERVVRSLRELGLRDEVIEKIMGGKK